ncbi:MAG: riboflavin kinase [Bdellovibrionales bacterium]
MNENLPDLYGQDLEVEIQAFLREEKVFSQVSQLSTQIQKDIQEALNIL